MRRIWRRVYGLSGFQGKTLWDWLQLLGTLAIPIVVAGGIWWLNTTERRAEREIATGQIEAERALTETRVATDREIAEDRFEKEQSIAAQRAVTDREIANDRFRENLLQSYFDTMTELLLVEGLRTSGLDDEVRAVAQIRTLAALRQLDVTRKGLLVQFLNEAKLILAQGDLQPIISLRGTNLRGADLSQVDLSGASLEKVDFRSADLSEANLSGANLRGVDLRDARLRLADLSQADLTIAKFHRAYLVGANLSEAQLGCGLIVCTNFTDATVSCSQLAKAKSVEGRVTMPDGTKFGESIFCPAGLSASSG